MSRYWRHHLLWPTLLWLLAVIAIHLGDTDLWLAQHLYQLQGGHWLLRDHWLTYDLLHEGGRLLVALLLLANLGLLLWAGWRRQPQLMQAALMVLASVVTSMLLVNLLKGATGLDCPWDLQPFGGERLVHDLFASLPAGQPGGRCFPAGHASGGYGWVVLYFAALSLAPRWRWRALAVGLGLGLAFGVGQQLRGAHFLSHDLWTLALCWWCSCAADAAMRQVAGWRRQQAESCALTHKHLGASGRGC